MIKSVISCHGHLGLNNCYIYYASANISLNSLKLKEAESSRHFARDLGKKLVAFVIMLVPGPFNGSFRLEGRR